MLQGTGCGVCAALVLPCQVPLLPTQSLQELAEHQDYDLWAMDGIYLATSTIRGLESKPDSEQWEEPRQLL